MGNSQYGPTITERRNSFATKQKYRGEGSRNKTKTRRKDSHKNYPTKNSHKNKNVYRSKKYKKKEINVFMVGLDGAGKSTILYKHLARDTYSSGSIHIPQTITYNVETVKSLSPTNEELLLNIYDFGGKKSTRNLWINYKNIPKLAKSSIDFIILVIDCSDLPRLNDENFDCAHHALAQLLNIKNNVNVPLCIFANKQDLPNAITEHTLPYRLHIKQITVYHLIQTVDGIYHKRIPWKVSQQIISFLPTNNHYWNMSKRQWSIFGTNSKTGQGIKDGLQWLYDEYERQTLLQRRKSSFTQSFTRRFSRLTM